MWKIAAVAVLLLASSSFGAYTLIVPTQIDVAPQGSQFIVDIGLDTGGATWNGIGLSPVPDDSAMAGGVDQLFLVKREMLGAGTAITDFFVPDADLPGKALDNVLGVDIGGLTTNANTHAAASTGAIMRLTLQLAPGLPVDENTDLHIAWMGSMVNATGGVAELVGGDGSMVTTIHLVPEPASMLLLAVGAAFFARRRRA